MTHHLKMVTQGNSIMSLMVNYFDGDVERSEEVYYCRIDSANKTYFNKKLKGIFEKEYMDRDDCIRSLLNARCAMFKEPDTNKTYTLTSVTKVTTNVRTHHVDNDILTNFQESFKIILKDDATYTWSWV